MDRGEFVKLAEAVTFVAEGPQIDIADDDFFLDTKVPALTFELIRKVAEQAAEGNRWASIMVKTPLDSPQERRLVDVAVGRVSSFAQSDGFQTDEVYEEIGGNTYRQLTVFWSHGKAEYESQRRIGQLDLELLAQAKAEN